MSDDYKTKERVKEYGEVFTSDKIVDDMLSLVDNELYRIDSRFLEPACGTGNFLEPILKRKLVEVKRKYRKVQVEYEQQSLLALGAVYGIELLPDNTEECRNRLYNIWLSDYKALFKSKVDSDVIKGARYILSKNIICGDAIKMIDNNDEKIVFSEWSLIISGKIQRKDYCYSTEVTGVEEPDVLLNQYVSNYRRIWEYVD